MRTLVVAILLIAVAGVLGGCSSATQSTAESPEDQANATMKHQRSELEKLIKRQLPRNLYSVLGVRPTVERPTCVHRSGGQFKCMTAISWRKRALDFSSRL